VGTSSKPSFKFPSIVKSTSVVTRNMPLATSQELSDMIIDFLHNDVAALCIAGLVCRSWVPSSRFHLFSKSKIEIHGPRRLELICNEGSTIPPYILHLSISNGVQSVDEALLRLPLLSNLKTLSLSWINMACLSRDAKNRLTTMLQNLTSLDLSYFIVRNYFSLYPQFILSHLRYWNSLKPLIKRLILLRLPLVWRIFNFGVSVALSATVKAPIILRRQLPRP
jgi:hypothetical protein